MKESKRRLENRIRSCLRRRMDCLELINLEITDEDLKTILSLIKECDENHKIQNLNLTKNLLTNESHKLLMNAGFKNLILDPNVLLPLSNSEAKDEEDHASYGYTASFLCCWKRRRSNSGNLLSLSIQSNNPVQNSLNAPLLVEEEKDAELELGNNRRQSGENLNR